MRQNRTARHGFGIAMRIAIVVAVTLGARLLASRTAFGANPLRIGLFQVDATPPVGSPLAYFPMEYKRSTLWLKGVVLLGRDQPIVLVAVDWIGIGGEGQTQFRREIARAVGTTAEHVAVHCLHQHDAPRFDLGAEKLLAEHGLSGKMFDVAFTSRVIAEAAEAAKHAAANARMVTHVGLGQATVQKVASNRRILGADGKIKAMRWTGPRMAELRKLPEGLIDPSLKSISFYQGEHLLAVVTYYAVHPVSYSWKGPADSEFVGTARQMREKALGVPHIHFTGAAGNLNASKYNEGSPEHRELLAQRLAQGMADAVAATEKFPVTADDLDWKAVAVSLPPAEHLDEQALLEQLGDEQADVSERISAAKALAFLRRTASGATTDITCLVLGKARVLHMPGELFVEYQLKAAKLRPDLFVAMAAYGEYAPGYIGTEIAYAEGGYEPSARVSRVAPSVERVLMQAVEKLLEVRQAQGVSR